MNDFHHITTQQELERLIERYFDGMTTVEEEKALRSHLAHCPWSSQAIDEARMVMGYFAAHGDQQRQHTSSGTRQRIIGIAASIAVILAVGTYAIWHLQRPSDVCIAYVDGHVIQSDEKVLSMIADDMDMMDNAANAMTHQLSSLGEALELDNE